MGSVALTVVPSVIVETRGTSWGQRVVWAGKLVHSLAMALLTSLLMLLSGSSSSTQDSLVGLASPLIVPPCTLPSRKVNALLDNEYKFCRKEERD